MGRSIFFGVLLLFILQNSSHAEVLVQTRRGNLSDFILASELATDIRTMVLSKYVHVEMPIDESSLSEEERKRLAPYLEENEGKTTLQVNYKSFGELPVEMQNTALKFLKAELETHLPIAYPMINLEQNASELRNSFPLGQLHPHFKFQGTVGAEKVLGRFTSSHAFKMSGEEYTNCAFSALNSITDAFSPDQFMSVSTFDNTISQSFQEVQPPLQWGDLIRFVIPQDIHVMVYVGTDQMTHRWMTFTKNGLLPSPFLFMEFDAVNKLYSKYTQEIKYYRQIKPISKDYSDPRRRRKDKPSLKEGSSMESRIFQGFIEETPVGKRPLLFKKRK